MPRPRPGEEQRECAQADEEAIGVEGGQEEGEREGGEGTKRGERDMVFAPSQQRDAQIREEGSRCADDHLAGEVIAARDDGHGVHEHRVEWKEGGLDRPDIAVLGDTFIEPAVPEAPHFEGCVGRRGWRVRVGGAAGGGDGQRGRQIRHGDVHEARGQPEEGCLQDERSP